MIGVCERENVKDSTVFVCLTRLWKHMASVCNCYCCGDHDGWIIVLYTPSTLHCWKVLFIYLCMWRWVINIWSHFISPKKQIVFLVPLGFHPAVWPTGAPFHEQLKKKCFKMCSKIPPKNLQYKDAKESENEKQPLESSEKATKVMQQFTRLCKLGISHERYLEK